jgi:hypothetical protein
MVIFGRWQDQSLTLSPKPNSLTLSLQPSGSARNKSQGENTIVNALKDRGFQDAISFNNSQVYSFDNEGRLWTAMRAGVAYRRGLNGHTVAKWQVSPEQHERRWLSADEANQLEETARQVISDLIAGLRAGSVTLQDALPDSAHPLLERAARFSPQRYRLDVQKYHQVYKPVGILPPDQYMAVVLQATEGCSFNTCTFCNFYRDRRFRIKHADEFRAHARAVRDYLGEGLSLRRTIFLGDANALVVPMPRLVELLDVVHQTYAVERLGGIYAFLDGFSGEKKSAADYRELAQRGVKRIYIGMESGSAALLRFLKKPGKPEDVLQSVSAIKAAGLAVGMIVLLGAGGHSYARDHIQDTIAALNAMPLDLDDLLYFSELVESEGLDYTQPAYHQQLRPLTSAERIAQGEEIETGLKFNAERGIPHISRYDIREFVY